MLFIWRLLSSLPQIAVPINADISIEYRSDDVTEIIFFEIMGYDVIFL